MERKHVSDEERKKDLIIYSLLGVLTAIFIIIIIIMIPKGKENDDQKYLTSKVSEQKEKNNSNSVSNTVEIERDKDKVTLKLSSITEDGAVIVITDKNETEYDWYPKYRLQQKVDKKWEDLEIKNPENMIFANSPIKSDNGVVKQSLAWADKYGSLPEGEYRVVKETGGEEFYAEFEID